MKPLEGIKVLDFTQFFAGPLCTLLLSDLGADVIKFENPPGGDPTRYTNVIKEGKSSNFTTRNRGKKSVVLNLKDEKQKAILLDMVKDADLIIENYKPGTFEKFGLNYDVFKEINPAIVYTSISGYGQDGPYRNHAAFDGAVQAEGGIISVTGDGKGVNVKCGTAIADATAGLIGCIGTVAAIHEAKMTGKGRRVDVSMMDSMVTIMENLISSYTTAGVIAEPTGNRMYTASPFNVFTCKGGDPVYLGISTDKQFAKFCEIINRPDMAKDPRFASSPLRVQNHEVLEGMTQDAVSGIGIDELCEELQAAGLVYGRINNVRQVAEHPQVAARNMLVDAVYPDGTTFRVPGCAIKLSDNEEATSFRAPEIGGDTFDVLSAYADEGTLHEIFDDVLKKCADYATAKFA